MQQSYDEVIDSIPLVLVGTQTNLIPETFFFTHNIILPPRALRSQFYTTTIIFDILIKILEERPTIWIVLLMFWSLLKFFDMCVYVIYYK